MSYSSISGCGGWSVCGVLGSEAMKWQAVASPMAPPQTCGATRRFWACARVAMRLASVRPPVPGTEGCTMSMQRPSIRARKSRTV